MSTSKYLILVVEESASRLGFYDSETGQPMGHVELPLWPHEVAISDDGKAYVSNFGVRDYDLTLGYAGNSISVVDIVNRCEVGRLITQTSTEEFWGPHGVKVSPDQCHVYVNVERVMGVREPDLDRPGSEYTKLLRFDRSTGRCLDSIEVPLPAYDPREVRTSKFLDATVAYDVLPGTHNFVFSPENPDELWLFSGRSGVSVMDTTTGKIVARLREFNGAVRALSFGQTTGVLLVSATNEVSLVDPRTREVLERFSDLGVGQILYSKLTPDEKYILAPAVWEGQILVISVDEKRVVHRLSTGVDPVQVMIAPDGKRAYVTHGRSRWLSYIDLDRLDRVGGRIETMGGPNGAAFAPWSPQPRLDTLQLVAFLPFTGRYSVEGRELRLGYQHWRDLVNGSGGLVVDGKAHKVEISYFDTFSSIDEHELGALVRSVIEGDAPSAILGGFPAISNRWIAAEGSGFRTPFISGLPIEDDGAGKLCAYAVSLSAVRRCALEGVFEAIRHGVSPTPARVAILAADETPFTEEAVRTTRFLDNSEFSVLPDGEKQYFAYDPGGKDLKEVVGRVSELAPDFLAIIGDREGTIQAVETCAELYFRPGGVAVTCGCNNAVFKAKVGSLGQALFGSAEWISSQFSFAEDRFGSSEDLARTYFERYSEPASDYAAAASAAVSAIELAVQVSGGSEDLHKHVRALDYKSIYGPVKFGSDGRNKAKTHGAVQLAMVDDELIDIHIWPRDGNTTRPTWPR